MNDVIFYQPVTKIDFIIRIIAVGGPILLFIICRIIDIINKHK